jgi:hypothetical protein
MHKRWLSFAAGVFAACMVATGAQAVTYTINNGNAALSGYTPPYATVDVTRNDSTTATVTFDSLLSPGGTYQYMFGGTGAAAVNVNASSWTIDSFTATSFLGFTPGPLSNGGAGNEDGFGSFNQTVDSFDGYTHASNQISFVLHNTGGTWLNDLSVLTLNASGFPVAAHIFVCTPTADGCNPLAGALATGFATTPLPGAFPLFASGLGLMGMLYWRRKRKVAPIAV